MDIMKDSLCVRFERGLLEDIDSFLGFAHYTSRAEFIRDAVRKLVQEYHRQKALMLLEKYKGVGKKIGARQLTIRERDQLAKDFIREKGYGYLLGE